jgi:hypothetical protein
MPRHEPLGRPAAGAPPGMKVRVRRGPDGRMEIVPPERVTVETVEAAERPPTPDDPRTANMRNVPPFGGGGA